MELELILCGSAADVQRVILQEGMEIRGVSSSSEDTSKALLRQALSQSTLRQALPSGVTPNQRGLDVICRGDDRYNSVAQHLPDMHRALSSIPSTEKRKDIGLGT